MGSTSKDIKKLIKDLEEQGFVCRKLNSGHWQVRREGRVVGVVPGTPSDSHSLPNSISQLRRNGYVPPGRRRR